MNNNPKLPIEIIQIEPEAVHEGTVYDQTVIARLQNGAKMSVFDSTPISIGADKIGSVVNVSIHILPKNGVKLVSNGLVGVYPPEDYSGKWSHDFVGDIADIDTSKNIIFLDIGDGIVSFGFDEDIKKLISSREISLGDRLYVPGQRTDINN